MKVPVMNSVTAHASDFKHFYKSFKIILTVHPKTLSACFIIISYYGNVKIFFTVKFYLQVQNAPQF